MELWSQMMNRMMNDYLHDFSRFERSLFPYWRNADHSIMHVADETQQVVDDDKKFVVALDVSQFHPEELKVNLDGRELIIEGKQERKTDNSFLQRHRTLKHEKENAPSFDVRVLHRYLVRPLERKNMEAREIYRIKLEINAKEEMRDLLGLIE